MAHAINSMPSISHIVLDPLDKTVKSALDPFVQAALDGDVKFLRKAYEDNLADLSSYFLGRLSNGNFIHRAVKMNRYTFVSDALEILPPDVVLELVCQVDTLEGSNPLHYAAKEGNIFMVKLLVNAYVSASTALKNQGTPPWLTKNKIGNTPSHSCFIKKTKKSHEFVARHLVSRDHHLQRSLSEGKNSSPPLDESTTMAVNKQGTSLLFCAMRQGFSSLAEQILTSGLPYSSKGIYNENPLHHASKCNEKVATLLLEKHSGFNGNQLWDSTILNRAVEDNATWLVKLMLIEDDSLKPYSPRPWNKACRRLIWRSQSHTGDTPLHIAAKKGYTEIAKLLVQGYEAAIRDEAEEWDVVQTHFANGHLGVTPFHIENTQKDVPLFVALKNKRDDVAVYLLSVTSLNVMDMKNGQGNTPYEMAIENGCEESTKAIIKRTVHRSGEELLKWSSDVDSLHASIRKIVQHYASRYAAMDELNQAMDEQLTSVSDDVVKLVVEGIPMFSKHPKKDAKLQLKEAAERNAGWLVKLLLEGDSSLINDSTPAWQIACEKGHLSTLLAFLDQRYRQEFINHCLDKQQTPLHHIKLIKHEDYRILLEHQVMRTFINQPDSNRATPLHRAIECNDLLLTKALLEIKGIQLDIPDEGKKTALDLISERCNDIGSPWYELYKELLLNPKNMDEWKNCKGVNDETPMHRAIRWNDFTLARILLKTPGVELNIKDKMGKTALDLLDDPNYKGDKWAEICREARLDPSHKMFKFKYLQRRTSLKDMHNTLSVVAALLATITFAAGFTVPGGVDNTDGSAILGKQAAFLTFSITNTIAMCSSMLVLFTVIGAMIWEAHPDDTFLIDSCVFLLQLSLCGTIVAFMTGVYAIMAPKVPLAGIAIIVLCSSAFFVALFVVSAFWPRLYKPCKLLKGVVCALIAQINSGSGCGNNQASINESAPVSPLQGQEQLTDQMADGPSSTVLADVNTQVINGASKSPTSAASPPIAAKLTPKTNIILKQPSVHETSAEHSQVTLQNNEEKGGISSKSQATGSEIKIDIEKRQFSLTNRHF